MAEPVNTTFENARLDAKTLEVVVNGSDTADATARLGAVYPSLSKAIKTMFENGGLPAKPFPTLAKMQTDGAILADGQLAQVYNETVNNGLYVKTAGAWVRASYDPETRLKIIEGSVFGGANARIFAPFTMSDEVITLAGVKVPAFENQYHLTSPIYLDEGVRINFNGYGENLAAISAVIDGSNAYEVLLPFNIGAGDDVKKEVNFVTTKAGYYVLGTKKNEGAFLPIFTQINGKSISDKVIDVRKDTENSLDELRKYLSESVEITDVENGGLGWRNVESDGVSGVTAKEVTLLKGDVLTFSHKPIGRALLWSWGELLDEDNLNKGFPLIATTVASDIAQNYTYTAPTNLKVRIVNGIDGTVKVNGLTPTITNVGAWSVYQLTNTTASFPNIVRSAPFNIKKGEVVNISSVPSGTIAISLQTIAVQLWSSLMGIPVNAPQGTSVRWVADSDCTIRVTANTGAKITVSRGENTLEDKLNVLFEKKTAGIDYNGVPTSMQLPEKEFVFATAMNYILKTEIINGVDYIKISQDLGKTWTQIPNILGDIVSYHFFSDGTIMLCSPQKVYWTDDYLTLNEATVYDHDGSVFVPTSRHFFAMQTGDKLDFVGDTEIHSWGDYHVDGTPARIWYTTDNGRTIKCSARFGVTDMGGVVRSIRHIHRVYYHQKSDYWYVTTGDSGNECMIIRGRYAPSTDTWAWEVLNSGIYYKFGNIMIDDDNIAFMITDYTEASQSEEKGIYRVHASNLGDFSKYRRIYKAEPSEWGAIAPVSLLLDPNGNKVILPDWLGSGYIWVASEGLDFKRVTVSPNVLLTYTIGENYNGDIYCVAYEGGNNLRLNSGSYNLTKALRDNGMTDFMRGSTLITGLKTVVS